MWLKWRIRASFTFKNVCLVRVGCSSSKQNFLSCQWCLWTIVDHQSRMKVASSYFIGTTVSCTVLCMVIIWLNFDAIDFYCIWCYWIAVITILFLRIKKIECFGWYSSLNLLLTPINFVSKYLRILSNLCIEDDPTISNLYVVWSKWVFRWGFPFFFF